GRPNMDLRRKQTRSDAFGTATPRIELCGEYDLSTKEEIASLFGSLRAGGPAVIDMTKVTYIDSTFLHELAGLRSRFMPHPITLLGVSEHLERLFHIMNFDHLFEVVKAG
ncbi:MAG: STAS domain-containing protein, partial [Candidatus Cybelea sp.]